MTYHPNNIHPDLDSIDDNDCMNCDHCALRAADATIPDAENLPDAILINRIRRQILDFRISIARGDF